tara:strand:+ start:94 stop:888 length:795 start_codon:yes stop_codon:yes gene_type:complete
MATKKEVFNEDFLKVRSNIPTLKKGESAASFQKRVKMWTSRTGLEYPKSARGLTGFRIQQTPEGKALSGESLGETDYTKGYSTELNQLIQSNMRRVDANKAANKLRGDVPTSGMSDIRGDLKIKQDEEAAAEDKIMFGDDIMNMYGPGGAKNDPTDTYDAGGTNTPLGAARRASFDPDSDDTDFNNNYDALENKVSGLSSDGTNGTSTRRNLMVGPAGISDRNVPKGYIRTGGKFASLNSVEGKRAKMRLDRLRKLQMKIKAGQ